MKGVTEADMKSRKRRQRMFSVAEAVAVLADEYGRADLAKLLGRSPEYLSMLQSKQTQPSRKLADTIKRLGNWTCRLEGAEFVFVAE